MDNNIEYLCELYAKYKGELDATKKLVDSTNSEIKEIMDRDKISTVPISNGKMIKCTTEVRETMNEDKLLQYLKDNGVTDAIRTKEFVDMDILEDLIYNGKIPPAVVGGMADCKITKTITKLLIVKNKEDKSNE